GVPDARVPGDALGERHGLGGIAPFEQLFGALVREIEARLHVDDGLAHYAETEMARLDDAGVHRPHRNLIDALASDFSKRKRLPVVGERTEVRVLTERVLLWRPEGVFHERPRIG